MKIKILGINLVLSSFFFFFWGGGGESFKRNHPKDTPFLTKKRKISRNYLEFNDSLSHLNLYGANCNDRLEEED